MENIIFKRESISGNECILQSSFGVLVTIRLRDYDCFVQWSQNLILWVKRVATHMPRKIRKKFFSIVNPWMKFGGYKYVFVHFESVTVSVLIQCLCRRFIYLHVIIHCCGISIFHTYLMSVLCFVFIASDLYFNLAQFISGHGSWLYRKMYQNVSH